jgi:hypothetical protein
MSQEENIESGQHLAITSGRSQRGNSKNLSMSIPVVVAVEHSLY